MDKILTNIELIKLYDNWITIVESQLVILRENRLDESFDQLRQLEMQKRNIRLRVMEYDLTNEHLDSTTKDHLLHVFQLLLSLNEQAEPYLRTWYDEATQDMKQVTTQQRILTSYGGAKNSDIISLYVDSKK